MGSKTSQNQTSREMLKEESNKKWIKAWISYLSAVSNATQHLVRNTKKRNNAIQLRITCKMHRLCPHFHYRRSYERKVILCKRKSIHDYLALMDPQNG